MARLSQKNQRIQEDARRVPFFVIRSKLAIWILSAALRMPGMPLIPKLRLMIWRQDIRTRLEIVRYGRRVTW
jgi:hypothetical protein